MPYVPQDVLDRLSKLERRVRQIEGRAQIRPAMNQILNGDTVIGEGGQLIAQAPGGTPVFSVGQTAQGDWGVALRREDGTWALSVGDDQLSDDQMVRMFSRSGEIIVMDDAYADRFLGRPWMPLQMHPTNNRGRYTSSDYGTAWVGRGPIHNAVAWIACQTYAGSGGAQARITLNVNGDLRTVDEWDCGPDQWTYHTVDYPMDGVGFLGHVTFSLDHRAKTNGQQVETRLLSAYTHNTNTSEQAPTPPVATATTTQEGPPHAA
ncbi:MULTISPECIES: hypothetical protein [Streptomyces rochei group]|uniref:hypothetical protein n=1 Tax=Streptomyces rochei group TaxID=2867164 RepID=UPI0018734E2A|nr:hypothetical protein [Streptomyces vinaceusdrappus]GHB98656.1 hypothetical protein GCM10010308_07610 [Streptomyces vinaceusdrappus]